MTRGLIHEVLSVLVVKQALFLIAAQALVPHRRPVSRVRKIQARLYQHFKNIRHVALTAGRDPSIHHVKIQPSIIVVIEKFGAPAPAGVVGSGIAGHIGEGEISVVVPEEIPLAHVIVGHVGDENVELAVIVEISPFRVHPFFRVKTDCRFGNVRERPVAVVDEEAVGAEIGRDVEVVPSVIVGIAVSQIQRPPAEPQTDLVGHVGEGAVSVVVKEQVHEAVVVVIEGNGLDGIRIAIESGGAGHVLEAAIPQVFEKLVVAETRDQQVRAPVIVVIEPERGRRRVLAIVSIRDASGHRHIGERQITVVVIEVVFSVDTRIGHEDIVETVAVIVTHRGGGAQRRVTGHDPCIGVLKGAVRVPGMNACRFRNVLKPATRRDGGVWPRPRHSRGASHKQYKH